MTSLRIRLAAGAAGLALGAPGAAPAQQQPNPQDILNQMGLGQMGAGATGLQVQQGTWIYPVRAGLHEAMLQGQDIGSDNGIDGDALARASLRAAYIEAGEPPSCPGDSRADMRGRSSIVVMTVETGSGPWNGTDQLSRLVVNQAQNRAALYLHGAASEWVPGPSFCDDGDYVLAGEGRGFLRMEYETTTHVAPLNFMAFPRTGDVDTEALEDACQRLTDLALDAYREMDRRWNTINHSYEGPVDWSVITPVPEGYGDGERASFADGTFATGDVVKAVTGSIDLTGLIRNIGGALGSNPAAMLAGATGVAQWAVMQAVQYATGAAGVATDPVQALMALLAAGNAAFADSGEPGPQQVADQAVRRLPDANGPYQGLDADYMAYAMLEGCTQPADPALAGFASGHFSWPGGTVPLSGRGLMPGQPAATASGPVGGASLSQALAIAQGMGVATPDLAQLQGNMPAGVSLDALPAPMAGQAGGGGMIAANAPEWTVSYNVELVDQGERIAADWFDPRR